MGFFSSQSRLNNCSGLTRARPGQRQVNPGVIVLGYKGDPVVEIIKTAFENGINMIDTAEAYAKGESEKQM